LQAYPDSLLTDLATAAAEQAGVMTGPISLDRDPTLFSHYAEALGQACVPSWSWKGAPSEGASWEPPARVATILEAECV